MPCGMIAEGPAANVSREACAIGSSAYSVCARPRRSTLVCLGGTAGGGVGRWRRAIERSGGFITQATAAINGGKLAIVWSKDQQRGEARTLRYMPPREAEHQRGGRQGGH